MYDKSWGFVKKVTSKTLDREWNIEIGEKLLVPIHLFNFFIHAAYHILYICKIIKISIILNHFGVFIKLIYFLFTSHPDCNPIHSPFPVPSSLPPLPLPIPQKRAAAIPIHSNLSELSLSSPVTWQAVHSGEVINKLVSESLSDAVPISSLTRGSTWS